MVAIITLTNHDDNERAALPSNEVPPLLLSPLFSPNMWMDEPQVSQARVARILQEGQEVLRSAQSWIASQASTSLEHDKPASTRQVTLADKTSARLYQNPRENTSRSCSRFDRQPPRLDFAARTARPYSTVTSRRAQQRKTKAVPVARSSAAVRNPMFTIDVPWVPRLQLPVMTSANVTSSSEQSRVVRVGSQTSREPEGVIVEEQLPPTSRSSRLRKQQLQSLQIPRCLVAQSGPSIVVSPIAARQRSDNMQLLTLARTSPPPPPEDTEVATQTSPVPQPDDALMTFLINLLETVQVQADLQQSRLANALPVPPVETLMSKYCATVPVSHVTPSRGTTLHAAVQTEGAAVSDRVVTEKTVVRHAVMQTEETTLPVSRALLTTAVQTDVESRVIAIQTEQHQRWDTASQTVPSPRPVVVDGNNEIP